MKIQELLDKKGHHVITAKPEATVFEVATLLRKHGIGCVVVTRDNKRIEGIVAVRDIAYAIAERADLIRTALGADILDAPAARIMTREVWCCGLNDTLRQVMVAMAKHHFLHAPVIEGGVLCGIVSSDDVVKYAVEEMALEKEILQESLLLLRTATEMR